MRCGAESLLEDLQDERLTTRERHALWSLLLVRALIDHRQAADRSRFRSSAAERGKQRSELQPRRHRRSAA